METLGASQAGSLQQSHAKTVQHLEEEANEEEGKGQLNFLSACQATLQASPPKFCGMLVASCHVLLGHAPTSHLFSISKGASPSLQGSALGLLPLLCLSVHLGPSSSVTLQTQWMSCLLVGPHPRQIPRGPPVQSGKK